MKNFSKAFVVLLCLTVQITSGATRFDVARLQNSLDCSLRVRANLYFGDESEEVAPIARTKFYLLDDDLAVILKQNGFNPVDDDNKLLLGETNYLDAAAHAFDSDDENSVLVSVLIWSAIAKRTAAKIETDASGIGEVKSVKPGKFYLFGITYQERETLVWNLPVELKFGENQIEIDQYNVATSIELSSR